MVEDNKVNATISFSKFIAFFVQWIICFIKPIDLQVQI
jgi:hypothetical protein